LADTGGAGPSATRAYRAGAKLTPYSVSLEAGADCTFRGPSSLDQLDKLADGLEQQPWHGITKVSYALSGAAEAFLWKQPLERGDSRLGLPRFGRPMASQTWYTESGSPFSLRGSVPKESCRPTACLPRDGYYGINKNWFGPEPQSSRPRDWFDKDTNKNKDKDNMNFDEYVIENQYKKYFTNKTRIESGNLFNYFGKIKNARIFDFSKSENRKINDILNISNIQEKAGYAWENTEARYAHEGTVAGYANSTIPQIINTGAGYAPVGQDDEDQYIVPSANPPPHKCVLPTYSYQDVYSSSLNKKVSFSNIAQVQKYKVYDWHGYKPCKKKADRTDMIYIEEEEKEEASKKTKPKEKKVKATVKQFACNCSSLSEKMIEYIVSKHKTFDMWSLVETHDRGKYNSFWGHL